MTLRTSQSNLRHAWALARTLLAHGAGPVVVSPGSRSTPLVLAFDALAQHDRPLVVLDERAAGFLALGATRVTGRPAVLVCTSGTAGAHYLPAVIEASESGLPLVVLTADRPRERLGIGSPQTIRQAGMFGGFVRGAWELAEPTGGLADSEDALAGPAAWASAAAQAVWHAVEQRGPVHVNVPFREPLWQPDDGPLRQLVGDLDGGCLPALASLPALPAAGRSKGLSSADSTRLVGLRDRLIAEGRGRTLLVAGPLEWPGGLRSTAERDAVATDLATLAEWLDAPVLVDGVSRLRGHAALLARGIVVADACLRNEAWRDRAARDMRHVLQIGRTPTSKPLWTWLAECVRNRQRPATVWQLGYAAHSAWGGAVADPLGAGSQLLPGDPAAVLGELCGMLHAAGVSQPTHAAGVSQPSLFAIWSQAQACTREVWGQHAAADTGAVAQGHAQTHTQTQAHAESHTQPHAQPHTQPHLPVLVSRPTAAQEPAPLAEGAFMRALAAALAEQQLRHAGPLLVHLASSMPVREWESWADPPSLVHTAANRGANGIDGLIATAWGSAVALSALDQQAGDGTTEGPAEEAAGAVVAVLGDLAFLHDLGGLQAAAHAMADRPRACLVLVVIDNGGGAIFERLPIAAHPDRELFERYFLTPHTVDPIAVAQSVGARSARRVTGVTPHAAVAEVLQALGTPGVHVRHLRIAREVSHHDSAARRASLHARLIGSMSLPGEVRAEPTSATPSATPAAMPSATPSHATSPQPADSLVS